MLTARLRSPLRSPPPAPPSPPPSPPQSGLQQPPRHSFSPRFPGPSRPDRRGGAASANPLRPRCHCPRPTSDRSRSSAIVASASRSRPDASDRNDAARLTLPQHHPLPASPSRRTRDTSMRAPLRPPRPRRAVEACSSAACASWPCRACPHACTAGPRQRTRLLRRTRREIRRLTRLMHHHRIRLVASCSASPPSSYPSSPWRLLMI